MAMPALDDGLLPMADDEEEKKKRIAAGANTIATPGSGENLALVQNQKPDGRIATPGTDPRASDAELMAMANGTAGPAEGPQLPPQEIPGGALTPEQEALASTVPANANGDDVDKLLAANPGAGALPPAPPASRPPVNLSAPHAIDAERSKVYNTQQDLSDQAVDAAKREGSANVAISQIQADEQEHHAAVLREYAPRIKEIADQNQRWATNQLAYIQQQQDIYSKMEPTDWWAKQSTGDKVLAGLAMVFGGAGRTSNKDNPGMQIINDSIEQDYRLQMARIEKQKANVAMAKEGYELGWTSRQRALADLQLQKAAALDQVAEDGKAMLMRQGVPLAQAQADANVVKLQQESLKTKQSLIDLAAKDRDAQTELAIKKLAEEARRKKLAGGAGGGGGLDQKAVMYSTWHDQHPQATVGERQAKALELGIPIEAKAGHVSMARLDEEWNKTPKGQASAQSALRRDRVAANIHEYEENIAQIKPGVLTPDVLAKVQDNESRIEGAKHSTALAVGGRWTGLVPRDKFEGLTNEQTHAYRAMEAALQHGAEMQPSTGAEVSQTWKETYRPTPAMSQQEIDASVDKLRGMGQVYRKIIDPTNIGARADGGEAGEGGAAKGGGGTPVSAAAPPPKKILPIKTNRDLAIKLKAEKTKPGDPDYDDAQAWLRAHGL